MRKIIIIVCLLFIFIGSVNAASIENFSKNEYEKLSKFVSDSEIELLSKRTLDNILDSDILSFDVAVVVTTYKTSSISLPKIVSQNIMSVDDYNNSVESRATTCTEFSIQLEECTTEYKAMVLMIGNNGSTLRLHITNEWIKMPKYKSFDVIALKWSGNYSVVSYQGNQYTNGNSGDIYYAQGNGNYKTGVNAIGLSQNLVDSATEIMNELVVFVTGSGTINLNATYQHSQANITLATSKLYNFSSNGYGGVLSFYGNAAGIYDNTPGMNLVYTP